MGSRGHDVMLNFFFKKRKNFWYHWKKIYSDQLSTKNLGLIMTLVRNTGCQSLLTNGFKS